MEMTMARRCTLLMGLLAGLILAGCSARPSAAQTTAGTGAAAAPNPDPWPRRVQLADAGALVYQPQVESWSANQLKFRCAVGITPTGSTNETFGVIWGSARTEVERDA